MRPSGPWRSCVVLAFLASACSGGGVLDAGAEVQYLDAVAATMEIRADALSRLDDLTAQTYGLPQRVAEVAHEVAVIPRFEAAATAAAAIDPPRAYVERHLVLVAALETSIDTAETIIAVLETGEWPGEPFAREFDAFRPLLDPRDPPFCRAVAQGVFPDDQMGYACPDEIPSGAYGEAVHAAMRRIPLEVFPRIANLGSDPDGIRRRLAAIQPVVESIFREVREDVAAQVPPDGLRAQHAAVLAYLDAMAGIAAEITAAAEAGAPMEELEELFARSAEPGPALRGALADDGCVVVAGVSCAG